MSKVHPNVEKSGTTHPKILIPSRHSFGTSRSRREAAASRGFLCSANLLTHSSARERTACCCWSYVAVREMLFPKETRREEHGKSTPGRRARLRNLTRGGCRAEGLRKMSAKLSFLQALLNYLDVSLSLALNVPPRAFPQRLLCIARYK